MSREIKNTLFRFATMRAPELAVQNDQIGFIKHPSDLAESAYQEVLEHSSMSQKSAVITSVSESLASGSFKTKEDVQNFVGEAFYEFSSWLVANRQTLTKETAGGKAASISRVAATKVDRLWDELFYQIKTYASNYVREALFSVLTAQNFLSNFSELESDEDFQKLAQAKIVIPSSLFKLEATFGSSGNNLPVHTKALDKELNAVMLKDQVDHLTAIKKDVEKLHENYIQEQRIAQDKAYQTHVERLKALQEETPTNEQEYLDTELNIQRKYVSFDPVETPDFEFEPAPQLQNNVYAKNAQSATSAYISQAQNEHGYETYEQVATQLENEIGGLNEELFESSDLEETVVNYNGTQLPLSNVPAGSVFSMAGTHVTDMTLLFNTDFEDAFVVSADYQITFGSGSNSQTVSATSFEDSSVNDKLSVKIFTNNETNFSGKSTFSITGELVLNTNKKVTFSGIGRVTDLRVLFVTIGYHLFGKGNYTLETISDGGSGSGDGNGNPNTGGTIDYVPSGYGIKRLGITDYRKVEQTICCYVPGEVSHIENIMAREFKEKETRRLRRREDTTVLSNEKETESLTDTTTTDRFEMNQEASSVIAEDRELNAHAEFSAKWGTGVAEYGLNAGADFSTSTSTEQSNSQAVTYAKDVTERALDRVVQKVKEERTIKIVEEFSEKNIHGFDNRQGDSHISGVYRWVDKIYKNQVINYGKRLMYEFMIPEPAAFHNIAIKGSTASDIDTLVRPKDPRTVSGVLNLKDYTKITESTYAHWAGLYNAEVSAPPKKHIAVGESFNITINGGAKLDHTESNSGNGKIRIPEGYKATHASGVFHASSDNDYQGNILSLTVGTVTKRYTSRFLHHTLYLNGQLFGQGFVNEVPVSYTLGNHISGDISATVYCDLTAEAEKQWKIDTFNAIIKAYENKYAEYEAKSSQKTTDFNVNPGFFRQIENEVLRKNCIEYLVSQANVGNDFVLDRDEVTSVRADYSNADLETYAARVKFFEQAFEWNIMSYNFYPFYWADKNKWKSSYNVTEFNDPLHRSFLQSGMARVIVTVRPGFEEVVNWYMATGQVWNGGQVPTLDDELFLSIVEELREPEGAVEDTWETRVPTALTVIQAGAIGLDVEGLPCNTDCNDFKLFDSDGNEVLDADGNSFTNPIVASDAQIGGDQDTDDQSEPG